MLLHLVQGFYVVVRTIFAMKSSLYNIELASKVSETVFVSIIRD
jgi:hypothetical protein